MNFQDGYLVRHWLASKGTGLERSNFNQEPCGGRQYFKCSYLRTRISGEIRPLCLEGWLQKDRKNQRAPILRGAYHHTQISSTNETSLPTLPLLTTGRVPTSYIRGAYRHKTWKCLCKTLGDSVEHRLVFNVVLVVSLKFGGETVQGTLQSIFGGGVDHLGLRYGVSCFRSA